MLSLDVSSFYVLVVTAALLFYVAANDLREFQIRNEFVLVLAGLYFVHAALSGRWIEMHWHVGLALIGFLGMLYYYRFGLIGGGDLKLMTVALLWAGVHCALPFLAIVVIVALLHAGAGKLGWVRAKEVKGSMKIPLAPSIAAGLIGVFVLGCLAPV
jgi:prepilin peptidase CpaA